MTATEQIHDIDRRRAWVIWAVGLSVYFLTVFHRSSLGVAGLLAADRFGPRSMLLSGLVLMTAGQLVFAFATTFPVAVGARAVRQILVRTDGPTGCFLSPATNLEC